MNARRNEKREAKSEKRKISDIRYPINDIRNKEYRTGNKGFMISENTSKHSHLLHLLLEFTLLF